MKQRVLNSITSSIHKGKPCTRLLHKSPFVPKKAHESLYCPVPTKLSNIFTTNLQYQQKPNLGTRQMKNFASSSSTGTIEFLGKQHTVQKDPIAISSTNGKEENKPQSQHIIRLGEQSDVPSILELFSRYATKDLVLRSPDHIKTMIDKEFVVLMECKDDGSIGAYLEFCMLDSKKKTDEFLMEVCNFTNTIPHHDNDIFIYTGGALRKPSLKSIAWYEKAMEFGAEYHKLDVLIKNREDWQNKKVCSQVEAQVNLLNQDTDMLDQPPGRIVFVGGTKKDYNKYRNENPDMEWYYRGQGKIIPHSSRTHLCVFDTPLPDNSSCRGSLVFEIFDRPLTAHQKERTKRNRYLITEHEQQRLLGTRIGIIGLSTGSVALEALLREGVGGVYRLADFDSFELSNGNRMLYSKSDIGKSKVELCVDRIKSFDTDIAIETFPHGLSKDNISDFVKDCDIIIEECDDFLVKFLVRHEAKKNGTPLLMATSQNGMIDVERYDIDDQTQIFHLDNDRDISRMMTSELSAEEKADVLSKLYDSRLLSPRFKKSSNEIGHSISSWPQLAEEVFLGAATLTHISRRVLLGDKDITSGRYSVNMDSIFTPENRISTSTYSPESSMK